MIHRRISGTYIAVLEKQAVDLSYETEFLGESDWDLLTLKWACCLWITKDGLFFCTNM